MADDKKKDDTWHHRNILWLPVDIVVGVSSGVARAAVNVVKGVAKATGDAVKDATASGKPE